MALDVTDPIDRALADSDKAVAACDRANDHEDDEVGIALETMRQARQDHLRHRSYASGFSFGGEKSNIDQPWVWPKTAAGREGRLHLCAKCGTAKPYSEFTLIEWSQKFTGRNCNECIG